MLGFSDDASPVVAKFITISKVVSSNYNVEELTSD